MKRFLILSVVALLLLSACAQPAVVEVPTAIPKPVATAEPIVLTWWSETAAWCCSDGRDELPEGIDEPGDLGRWMIGEFRKRYPQHADIEIDQMVAAYAKGLTVELDTLIAGGEIPNILNGYAGRMGSYVDIAVPLEDYFDEEQRNDFLPGEYEAQFLGGDHIYAVSTLGAASYYLLNADLMRRAGIEVPEPWSVVAWATFLEWGEKVKALDDGSYLACIHAAEPSGWDHLMAYFAGAGVAWYTSDLSGVAANTPVAVEVLTELVRLHDEGFLVPGVSALGVFDCIDYLKTGKLALYAGHWGHTAQIGVAVEAGILDEPYEAVPMLAIQFKEDITPLIAGSSSFGAALVTVSTPEEARKAAFDFAFFVNSHPWADREAYAMPRLKSQVERGAMPTVFEAPVSEYIREVGRAEHGFICPHYTRIREMWAEEMSAVFLHVKTPEKALTDWERQSTELFDE